MARRNIVTGIDIGSSTIRIVVAEYPEKGSQPVIIGTGFSESQGLRHGYIINTEEASRSVADAVAQAEKASGVRIKRAFLAVGGISLESEIGVGSAFVSRADNEVTDADVQRAAETAEEHITKLANKQILHAIPVSFKLDGEEVLGRPQGMTGNRLEIKTLFITSLKQHLQDLIQTVEEAGVEVQDVMASPIAASFVTLNKRQKTAGCVLANIGAETLSIAVFENGIPISIKVFPIGGTEITQDIALGLQISLEEAEEIKRGRRISSYPKKKLEDIITARLSDIFDLINAHLKGIGKNGLLPAGIIITGGGSAIDSIAELAKSTLHIPSKIATPDFSKNTKHQIKDATFAVAYGLCIMGLDEDEESSGIKIAKNAQTNLLSWVKQFLP